MKYYNALITLLLFYLSGFAAPLNAQRDTLSVLQVGDKTFLSLIPEAAPLDMIWGEFGREIESYYDVMAYSNGSRRKGRKYQCTELVHRFLTEVYGIPSRINMGLGHGKDLARNLAVRYRSVVGMTDTLQGHRVRLENFLNNQTPYPPVVGSIVSMHFSKDGRGYGHVGIIRHIRRTGAYTLEATLFDQHGFMHNQVGLAIQPDKIIFIQHESGNWSGQVWSWVYDTNYPVISWTNPVVVQSDRANAAAQ